MIIDYLKVFLTGGIICMLGQLLINFTKMTSARILVTFLLIGVFLEAVNVYQYVVDFGGTGATIPIVGFGRVLVRGAVEGAASKGLMGALTGGISAASAGIASAIIFGFIIAIIFKPKTKS
ncbi:MAG: stage V sporulation protein AE [Christensenellales bacterium]|jgi:stage V sporulation protein AE